MYGVQMLYLAMIWGGNGFYQDSFPAGLKHAFQGLYSLSFIRFTVEQRPLPILSKY